jgi:hypothetical protein
MELELISIQSRNPSMPCHVSTRGLRCPATWRPQTSIGTRRKPLHVELAGASRSTAHQQCVVGPGEPEAVRQSSQVKFL